MSTTRVLSCALLVVCFAASMVLAANTEVSLKISGPGAVDSTTIKVGEPVNFDFYFANNADGGRGFTTGFCLKSEDIKKVTHVTDSGKGLNDEGDIKGYNGWQNTEVWDFAGVWTPRPDWDGVLPDTMGFAGAVVGTRYNKHEKKKVLSWSLQFDEAGSVTVDSCFVRPGTVWQIIHVDADGNRTETKPSWGGPYTFKVVK